MAVALLVLAASVEAATKSNPCGKRGIIAAEFRSHSKRVWAPQRWRRGAPKPKAIRTYRRALRCAAGPGHRRAIEARWGRDRLRYGRHRHMQLRRHDINHRWAPRWAPDWGGPTLPLYVIAALAERTGDVLGIDVPGWTMAQMTIGESGRRPGSAGVDPGGTRGYGLWAITWPFADDLLARYRWTYADMWNPVRNAVIMALIYRRQGLRAWYGDSHVSCWDCHYRGRFDLRLVLGGLGLRQAIPLR